jgi:hypothetical protein
MRCVLAAIDFRYSGYVNTAKTYRYHIRFVRDIFRCVTAIDSVSFLVKFFVAATHPTTAVEGGSVIDRVGDGLAGIEGSAGFLVVGRLAVYVAAMTDTIDGDNPDGTIDFVDDAIVTDAEFVEACEVSG